MNLAQLFYFREAIRNRVQYWRGACLRRHFNASPITYRPLRFFLEPLEPRLLLSATPVEVVTPQAVTVGAVTVPAGSLPNLDVDLNGQADALTDGVLIARYLFGFTGNALVDGVVDPAGQRTDPAAIEHYLNSISPALDVDLSGQGDALSDGIVFMRSLFGFAGNALTEGVIDPAGQRTDPAVVAAFLDNMNPQRELVAPVLTVGLQQDSGLSASDAITFDPTITGTIADINQIAAFTVGFDATPVDGFVDVLADLQANGTFTLTATKLAQVAGGALADGAHILHLRAIDTRGNVSAQDYAFMLDTLAPTAPALDLLAVSDSGVSATDNITNITDPLIEVLTDSGRFQLAINGVQQLDIDVVDSAFVFTVTTQLSDGPSTFTATLEDVAGNVASSFSLVVQVDTAAPAVSFAAEVTDVDPATPGTQVLEGTIIPIQPSVTDDGQISTVDLFVNGQVVQSNGSFPFDLSVTASVLAPGSSSSLPEPGGRVYSTNFQQTEDPISEGGLWLNGLTDGLDWSNIQTTPGFAFGTQTGFNDVDDSTALLVGAWGWNQVAQAAVVINGDGFRQEIELRLNSSLSAKACTGYEFLFDTTGTSSIVRWDGAFGAYEVIGPSVNLPGGALVTGDVLRATNVGGVLTAYVNGVQVAQVQDATYLNGSPGMGFFIRTPTVDYANFGLSSFSASSSPNDTALQVRATDVAGNATLSDPFFFSVVPNTDVPLTTRSVSSGVFLTQAVAGEGVLPSLSLPSEVVVDSLDTVVGTTATASDLLTNLAGFRLDPRFQEFDGRGTTAVVIDTGIDVDHPFFGPDADHNGVADRIVFQWDFADNDADASDRVGHGSHIASLIGSEDLTYPGVAPEANLIALKVFSDTEVGTFAFVEQALQWVVAHAVEYGIDVVNLSLGDGQNWTTPDSHYGLGDEFAALANDGIIVVAAAGNSFFTAQSRPGVSYPAADPNVIGVGAVWTQDFGGPWRWSSGAIDLTTGADRIASFSQRDPTMTEIFAPGARLTGANHLGGTVTMQGTSQAAAYLSGTALLAQQMAEHELGRKLTPQEFTDLVVATGKKIVDGDDEQDNVVNTGLTFARVDMRQLAKGVYRYEDKEWQENGHHRREHEFALAYAQRCWVKDFVSDGSGATDEEGEEFLIALPG